MGQIVGTTTATLGRKLLLSRVLQQDARRVVIGLSHSLDWVVTYLGTQASLMAGA